MTQPQQPNQPPPPVQDPPASPGPDMPPEQPPTVPSDLPPTGPGIDEPETEIEEAWPEDENPEAHESPV